MTHKEDVKIVFETSHDIWHWHLSQGKYAAGGSASTLEEAEANADKVAMVRGNTGIIQKVYPEFAKVSQE